MAALFLWILLCAVSTVQAVEVVLMSAGAPYAPSDISKSHDPYVPLAPSERREITREFKALLSMGVQPVRHSEWEGRDISDCVSGASGGTCKRCEIQMGQSRANYLFAPQSGSCRLGGIEVHVDSSDRALMRELQTAARRYVGTEGQFYLDENGPTGEANLRFVWHR